MDPAIRKISESPQIIPVRAKQRREGDGSRKRFQVGTEDGDETESQERPAGEGSANRGETSVGHRLDGEAGSRVDVTA